MAAHGALAFYMVDIVARECVPVPGAMASAHGWPDGVLALVNDPLRTVVWQGFFSELPNDRVNATFRLASPADVEHLVQLLAQIRAAGVRLELEPGDGPADPLGSEGRTVPGASFTVGNQEQLSAWFDRLPEVAPGVRQFGVHRSETRPVAAPPTLVLYVDNPHVRLETLEIPAQIAVEARANWRWDEATRTWSAPPEAIRRVVEAHRARQGAGASGAPPEPAPVR
jgi:hypothetical protein